VTDYAGNTNVSRTGVTVLRLVGNISLLHTDAVAATVWMGFFCANTDEGTTQQDPSNVQHLIDEDVLWTHVHRFGTDTGTNREIEIPFDIRVKRKLTEDEIRFQASTTGGSGVVTATFVCRALLAGDIT